MQKANEQVIDAPHQLRCDLQRVLTHVLILLTFVPLLLGKLSAQDLNLSPSRPTVANSVTIQDKGVLQAEIGYDAFPQHNPGNQQTVGTSLYYVPVERLRLDFGWSAFSHQEGEDGKASGIGTIQLGGKIVLVPEESTERNQGLLFNTRQSSPRPQGDCCRVSASKSSCS